MSSEGDPFKEEEVAKKLFPPTPEKAATKRDPLHKKKRRTRDRYKQSSFRTGLFGALIFLLLCVGVLFVTARLNNGWTEITFEGKEISLDLGLVLLIAV